MSKTLIPAQRIEQIRAYLKAHPTVSNIELVNLLQVSEATIRRDLEWLEKQGVLERTHGGAILSQSMSVEPEYAARALAHPEEKHNIGAAAAALIEEGDTIFINSGTTTTEVLQSIPRRAKVTVITNNLSAAEIHDARFELILLGGTYYPRSNAVVGHLATENLRRLNAKKTFIGADGISLKYGYTVPSNPEAELVRLMIEHTHGSVIVVADASKWGVVSNFQVARIDEAQMLVTDDQISKVARAELKARGVQVVLAGATPRSTKRARR